MASRRISLSSVDGTSPNASPDMKIPPRTAPNDAAMRTRSRTESRSSESTRWKLGLQVLVLRVVLFPMERLEGGLIPLMEEEDLAVGQHLIDDLGRADRPSAPGVGSCSPSSAECVEAELVQAQVQRHQNVFLAGEMVVERRLGYPELLGDLPERRLVEPLLDEQVECHIEDAFAGTQRRFLVRHNGGAGFLVHSPNIT